jgi:nicotinamidase-related amidase/type 1 glutamine amidotransferase
MESWDASQTAVIVCDMWDAHHCYNAVQRVKDMAPRMNEFLKAARTAGALIIHAPSSCMAAYESHPARIRALSAPAAADPPAEIDDWCSNIPAEDAGKYPIDQSDGGEDDDPAAHQKWHEALKKMGRDPQAPWTRQIDILEIDDQDAITDRGREVWNLLTARNIDQVILVGVHTNMCVLGRPFGLRQLAKNGKRVVLVRDLTDAMYNPAAWPFVSHHAGTDLIIAHIEKYVCPTIESTDLLGGQPHRFFDDQRKRLAMVLAEFEYATARTLPAFANQLLISDFQIEYAVNADPELQSIDGLRNLNNAEVALFSIWRRALPAAQLAMVRDFVAAGKPIVGIRTASHAFATRDGKFPAGHATWPDFDLKVFGAKYDGHYGNHAELGDPPTHVRIAPHAEDNPLLDGISGRQFTAPSWLYRFPRIDDTVSPLLLGRLATVERDEPVAWTYTRPMGGRSFYTSLGHPADFELPEFRRLLRNAVYWAAGLPIPARLTTLDENFVRPRN